MCWRRADIEHTDVLIAVTHNDEVNLLCCVVARKAANCHTIARVRNPVYSEGESLSPQGTGIVYDYQSGVRGCPGDCQTCCGSHRAIEIDSFSKGRIEMLRFRVPGSLHAGTGWLCGNCPRGFPWTC